MFKIKAELKKKSFVLIGNKVNIPSCSPLLLFSVGFCERLFGAFYNDWKMQIGH